MKKVPLKAALLITAFFAFMGNLSIITKTEEAPSVQQQELREITGKIKKGAKIEVKRDGAPVISGKVTQIKYVQEEISEATAGKECGMMFIPAEPTDKKIMAGDILEVYEEEIKRPTIE